MVDLRYALAIALGIGVTFALIYNFAFARQDILLLNPTQIVTVQSLSGTATMSPLASTVIVTHGLGHTPTIDTISVTPLGDWGRCSNWWVSNPTTTTFTINCNIPAVNNTISFSWQVLKK